MELKIYNPTEDGFLQSIDWNFEELKQWITKGTQSYEGLVVTPDQISDAKESMADMRKLRKALESERVKVKKKVLKPYDDFAAKEKELIKILDGAIQGLDVQVKEYNEMLRREKLEKVREIYIECIGDLDRTIPFEKILKDSWLNASTTLKSVKEEITQIRDKVDTDLKVINTESSAYAYEMKEEYLKKFDLSAAMAKKQELEDTAKKKALYEEQKQKEAKEREQKLKKEAARVERAGKESESKRENADPAEASVKERTLAITFKVTAKESQFEEVNTLLSKLKETCGSLEVLQKEEL